MFNPDSLIPIAKDYQDSLQQAAVHHRLVKSLSTSNRQTISQTLHLLWDKITLKLQKPAQAKIAQNQAKANYNVV